MIKGKMPYFHKTDQLYSVGFTGDPKDLSHIRMKTKLLESFTSIPHPRIISLFQHLPNPCHMAFVSLWYLRSHKQTAVTHSYILKGSQRAFSSFHWFHGECWEASNVERNLLSFLFFYVLHNLKSYPLFLL